MRLPIIHHPDYAVSFPGGRHFPGDKFGQLAQYLRRTGCIDEKNLFVPEEACMDWLSLVHCPRYIEAVAGQTLDRAAERRIGFPVTPWAAYRTRLSAGGAVLAGRLALQYGAACNTAGGGHHAHRDFGAGYCIFNDVAVALAVLRHEGLITRALVVDLDVHQGDGTAAIFRNDADIFTFSIHCSDNFPGRKSPGDLDIALPKGTGDADYLKALAIHLPGILDHHGPGLVFFNAGIDPHEKDDLGKLKLTEAGIRIRDQYVVDACMARGIPIASVIGGGYSSDKPRLARLHASVIEAAFSRFSSV